MECGTCACMKQEACAIDTEGCCERMMLHHFEGEEIFLTLPVAKSQPKIFSY